MAFPRVLLLPLVLVLAGRTHAGVVNARYATIYKAAQPDLIINLQEVRFFDADGTQIQPLGITASSDHPSHPMDQMIDGSFDTFGHSFDYGEAPWGQIDLGEAEVAKIEVYNRRGCCTWRTVGMQITLSRTQCTFPPFTPQDNTDCSDAELWTGTLEGDEGEYVFDNLPDAGEVWGATSTTSATTNALEPVVSELQGKLSEVEEAMEQQIEKNEKHVAELTAKLEAQQTLIEEQQAALTEQTERQNAKFAGLYAALATLSEPVPAGTVAPGGSCAELAPGVPEIKAAGDVLSVSACGGRIELNGAKCTVDPCDLSVYIAALKARFDAFKDI